MKPTFYKVNLKPRKQEPCRICNTKTRPNIDILSNQDLKLSIEEALDLQITSDPRFSKRICVVCMSLVNIMAEFKRMCYATQNELWENDDDDDVRLVNDRGADAMNLLRRAKNVEIKSDARASSPQTFPEKVHVKKEPIVVRNVTILKPVMPKAFIKKEEVENQTDNDMIEEYLDETDFPEVIQKTPRMFNCTYEGCHLKFTTQGILSRHINEVHKKQIAYRCQSCMKTFHEMNDLVRHRKIDHPADKNLHKCIYCKKHFQLNDFKRHVIGCQSKRRKAYDLSMLQTPSKYPKIPKELVQQKIMEDDRLYMCGICEEKFRTVKEYTAHLYIHSQALKDEEGDDDNDVDGIEAEEALRNLETTQMQNDFELM